MTDRPAPETKDASEDVARLELEIQTHKARANGAEKERDAALAALRRIKRLNPKAFGSNEAVWKRIHELADNAATEFGVTDCERHQT